MTDFVEHVFDSLHSWGGGEVLFGAMDSFPELEFFVAGGLVRDIILQRSRQPKDLDIFLVGRGADGLFELLKGYGSVLHGAFGSPEWCPRSAPDMSYDLIPVEGFSNGLWPCHDMLDALNQFDFTGNAIALNLRTRAILDPQNGIRDLSWRVLRSVRFDYPDEPIGPSSRLTRNGVLWWRFVHYAWRCELKVEPITLGWLRKNRHNLDQYADFADTFHPVDWEALDSMALR